MGVKKAKSIERERHANDLLTATEATDFRAMAARANYLALDRPDIAYSTKEVCKCFANPNSDAMAALKHLVRYLCGCPTIVWYFNYQPTCNVLVASVDTDFAGCLSTRRSTSGGAAMRGCHLLKHWSSTQGTVTLIRRSGTWWDHTRSININGIDLHRDGSGHAMVSGDTNRLHCSNWYMSAAGVGQHPTPGRR